MNFWTVVRHDAGYFASQSRFGRLAYVFYLISLPIGQAILVTQCAIQGHDYDSWADGENGTEDVWCCRCGHSFTARF
jgi:hypothetical protein